MMQILINDLSVSDLPGEKFVLYEYNSISEITPTMKKQQHDYEGLTSQAESIDVPITFTTSPPPSLRHAYGSA